MVSTYLRVAVLDAMGDGTWRGSEVTKVAIDAGRVIIAGNLRVWLIGSGSVEGSGGVSVGQSVRVEGGRADPARHRKPWPDCQPRPLV